jgi:copper(I)-binding protein
LKPLHLAVIAAVVAVIAVAGILLYVNLAVPRIEIHSPFFRRGTMASGVFFIAHNHGLAEGCIVGAEVLNPPNQRVEMHMTVIQEGKAAMVPVAKICVPAGGEVKALGIEGEGYHLMIVTKLPEDAKTVKIRIYLDNGSSLEFDAVEQELEAPPGGHHGSGHGGH